MTYLIIGSDVRVEGAHDGIGALPVHSPADTDHIQLCQGLNDRREGHRSVLQPFTERYTFQSESLL